MKKTADNLAWLTEQFAIYGDFISGELYGSGHINDTYRVVINQSGTEVHYIYQRINHLIFKNPPALMENIQRVTKHIASKLSPDNDNSRRCLTVIPTRAGQAYCQDKAGNYWRAYLFIEGATTYDIVENSDQAFKTAQAFGRFQQQLVDIPGGRLHETIPDFHNTPQRIAALEAAIAADSHNRVKDVQPEIEFILQRKDEAGLLIKLQQEGKIPERITHNDTKLNNVMIDDQSNAGICVIDLDTVMPGLVHYDFGDMVRTTTSPAAEDERDLSLVTMRFEMFEALLRGYLDSAGDFLNPTELAYLPFCGKLITLEIGTRFLTDYLQGDIYFKTHREGHNIDRCRTQIRLVESIEEQMEQMTDLLRQLAGNKLD